MDKSANMADDDQQLFLIEFLVERVNVPTVRAMQEEDILPSTTCVSFQILNLPPVNINQGDKIRACACPTINTKEKDAAANANEQIFKKGKSCLFALPAIAFVKPLITFPITMTVYKKLPTGVLPDTMLIGSHQIEIKDIINLLIKDFIFMGGNPSRKIKNTFKIKTTSGQPVGSVTLYLRASCFGKNIVTHFHILDNKKPFLFKGANNGPTFQCQKIVNNKGDSIAKITQQNQTQLNSHTSSHSHVHRNIYSHSSSNHHHHHQPTIFENKSKFAGADSAINSDKCECPKIHG
ncbi:hypothetical protein PV327_003147 [Microctonus hyperodae]|uniref:Uncharacterized protein n=1 Tax=Microctonus hyperodae TaxID=165561 RepID=A0AA39G3F9_MICHY|nr:hypothetical protein PV327_003147 [Microctonus hyperodae]